MLFELSEYVVAHGLLCVQYTVVTSAMTAPEGLSDSAVSVQGGNVVSMTFGVLSYDQQIHVPKTTTNPKQIFYSNSQPL